MSNPLPLTVRQSSLGVSLQISENLFISHKFWESWRQKWSLRWRIPSQQSCRGNESGCQVSGGIHRMRIHRQLQNWRKLCPLVAGHAQHRAACSLDVSANRDRPAHQPVLVPVYPLADTTNPYISKEKPKRISLAFARKHQNNIFSTPFIFSKIVSIKVILAALPKRIFKSLTDY